MYRDETVEFMSHWKSLLDCVMPGYVKEGKQQLLLRLGVRAASIAALRLPRPRAITCARADIA